MSNPEVNPIGWLLEQCQKYGMAQPVFEELGSSGPSHCPVFNYKCSFQGYDVTGSSETKKNAKREAAKNIVQILTEKNYLENFSSGKLRASQNNGTLKVVSVSPTSDVVVGINKNPVSALQEFCQAVPINPPMYTDSAIDQNNFVCKCVVLEHATFGKGSAKKAAKTESAAKMCDKLGIAYASQNNSNSVEEAGKNSISTLSEYCQKKKLAVTFEEKINSDGTYTVECVVGENKCEGSSPNKKSAKLAAASNMLDKLEQDSLFIGLPSSLSMRSDPPVKTEPKDYSYFNLDDEENDETEQNAKETNLTLDITRTLNGLTILEDIKSEEQKEKE